MLAWISPWLLSGLLCLGAPASAPTPADPDQPAEPEKRYWGVLSAYLENDVFLYSDDNYSSGIGFSWTSDDAATYTPKNFIPTIVRGVSFLPSVGGPRYRNFVSFTVGQEIYSPRDIEEPIPPPDQQPYAGVLFLDTSVFSHGPRSLHGFTLRLGCVGPCSGAEQLQKTLHGWTGDPIPQGWDYQLSNEFLLNLDYQYHRRLSRRAERGKLNYDFALGAGGGLGNYFIGANVGLTARLGYRIPDNYGNVNLRRSGTSMFVAPDPPPSRGWRWYLYAGLQGYVVGRFLPTDGNTFKESASVDRDDFAAHLSSGIVVAYGRFVATWTLNNISGLTAGATSRAQDYGTFTASFYLRRKPRPR
jgi:hypothetical protein